MADRRTCDVEAILKEFCNNARYLKPYKLLHTQFLRKK
jgi:hypothetical protein